MSIVKAVMRGVHERLAATLQKQIEKNQDKPDVLKVLEEIKKESGYIVGGGTGDIFY